ncbi:MAG: hypothetical protein ACI8RD_004962 [Bacillariaceae sp.]|jgi:hypothetical protein
MCCYSFIGSHHSIPSNDDNNSNNNNNNIEKFHSKRKTIIAKRMSFIMRHKYLGM